MAIIMAFELGTYGFIASLATRKLKLPIIPSLIMAMLAGRVIAGLTVAVLVQLFGVKINALMFVKSAIIIGLPGIIIQLIFIPTIIYAIKVYMKKTSTNV